MVHLLEKQLLQIRIINEISLLCQNERLVIMEDTEELQSNSENTCRMKTSAFVTMRDLLKSTMRLDQTE